MPKISNNVKKAYDKLKEQQGNDSETITATPESDNGDTVSKPRGVRILYRSHCGLFAVIRITENGLEEDYLFRWISSPSVYTLTKLEPGKEVCYTTILNGDDWIYCGCDGFMHRKECKHVKALLALHSQSKLS